MRVARAWTSRFRQFLRHAFAVRETDAGTSKLELDAAERVCQAIARRRMITPALVFLETLRPLNYVSAQMLHFFAPLATSLLDVSSYEAFARFLERRQSIAWLCQRLEELERGKDSGAHVTCGQPGSVEE